ncbi:MAG: thermostable hemolysin delta-VPH [Clostridia bacterium]|nr:thermostable hemolysin delta-VPH [Clostridia bacterium]
MYYNYHAVAKRLIREGHLTSARFFDVWGKLENPLVLFFDNRKPMPIRKERVAEYAELLSEIERKK